MERIGIDTHGYDEPPDEPEHELTDEETDRLDAIEEQIADLVSEYKRITQGDLPYIAGFVRK